MRERIGTCPTCGGNHHGLTHSDWRERVREMIAAQRREMEPHIAILRRKANKAEATAKESDSR